MTRTGPAKYAERGAARMRLAKAEVFLQASRDGLALLDHGEVADPVVSNIVTAAIAFADAVTATVGGVVNQRDHKNVGKLLRALLDDKFPNEQSTRLTRILDRKDPAQYGTGFIRREEAKRLLADIEKFAVWARKVIDERAGR